ncbi:MAG: cell division protein ZipA [Steroidobacteraceae bacterium]
MSQLRWTLLILGGVFVVALALWERLRPRQARGRAGGEPVLGGLPREALEPKGGERALEPWIADGPLEPSEPAGPWREAAPGAALGELPMVLVDVPEEPPELQPASTLADSWETLEEGVGEVRILGQAEPAETPATPQAAPTEPTAPAQSPAALLAAEPPLRVEWPPESERHIVALRLVAGPERFAGRMLRLALAAEGFRLGRFEIFHKPDDQGRAFLSAASLTRPGTFDLDAMDSQRYAGLSLFAVLPGPLPALQAFDCLLATVENLNERLQGEVQDERGQPLSGDRVALLRAGLPEVPGEALS